MGKCYFCWEKVKKLGEIIFLEICFEVGTIFLALNCHSTSKLRASDLSFYLIKDNENEISV